MKIRTNYVSNSSSSSFICYIKKDKFKQFKRDFEEYVSFLQNMFPKYEFEYFPLEFKEYSEREIVIKYIQEKEGVKYPSNELIEFFTKKLKEKDYCFEIVNSVGVSYTVDSELYTTLPFQEMCQSFIENYNANKG
jgi:hypothetical protein